MGLNAADSAVFVGEIRQHVKEIFNGQFAHGLEVIIPHPGGNFSHVSPQGVEIFRQVVAPAPPEFVQQNAAPVMTFHFDGIAEPAVNALHPAGDGLQHVFQKNVHGPAAAMVDDVAVGVAARLAHLVIMHGNHKKYQFPIPFGNVDGFQFRAPGPAKEHFLLKIRGDVHRRLRQHAGMLHFAHHGPAHVPGKARGKIAGEFAGAGDVVLIGNGLLLRVFAFNKGAAVRPAGAGGNVQQHPALFACPGGIIQNIIKFRGAEGNIMKPLLRVVRLYGIENLQFHAANARGLHIIQFPVDLRLFHAAAIPPPAGPAPGLGRRIFQ